MIGLGQGGRSVAKILKAKVERKRVGKKSYVPAERIQEGYLCQDQFLFRTEIASWRVFRLWNRDLNPWAVLSKRGLIAPMQNRWCIARPLCWHFSSAVRRLRACKADVWSWIPFLLPHWLILYLGSLVPPCGDPLLPGISKAQSNDSYRITIL